METCKFTCYYYARLKPSDGKHLTTSPSFVETWSIISVYAPQEDKDRFFDDLQGVVDSICAKDLLVVVGDFNARVGCGARGDLCVGVCGLHGVGQMNENGEALLFWCAQNGLGVMNTMFQKKKIHQYTWQHPGSKQWHCIDNVLMRQGQRNQCCDVRVLRSAGS